MAKIIVQSSEDRREFELGPVTTIGRHPHNAVQILDRIVSKEHAQIIRQPDGLSCTAISAASTARS
jgi:adenylate cyclase